MYSKTALCAGFVYIRTSTRYKQAKQPPAALWNAGIYSIALRAAGWKRYPTVAVLQGGREEYKRTAGTKADTPSIAPGPWLFFLGDQLWYPDEAPLATLRSTIEP